MYKTFIRPVLFLFDAEKVHNFVLSFFSKNTFFYPLLKLLYSPDKNESIKLDSIVFKNRLGLAAGFDKYGIGLKFFEILGFSHMEIGTVTPYPQPGNPKPRIFRLTKDKALINRLGFNNGGANDVMLNIQKARKLVSKDFIIGINIGKNRATSVENAVDDYKICINQLYNYASYFTLNISSPNTEGLRKLQEEKYLDKLLSEIQSENHRLSPAGVNTDIKNLKPVFVKIAPDLNYDMIEIIFNLCIRHRITGIIATNTTVLRPKLKSDITEEGGLSGKPLKKLSDEVLSKLNILNSRSPEKKLVLIASGGVFDKKDFLDKIEYGASLVQIYTGFVYEGPGIIKKILN